MNESTDIIVRQQPDGMLLREKVQRIVLAGVALLISFGIQLGATLIVQYTIEWTFDRRAPFIALFASLVALQWLFRRR